MKLSEEVITAAITRMTGKSLKNLSNSLSDQEKGKMKDVVPEECHRILESKAEYDTSFYVTYGLLRIFLNEKHHPKSGWGNPVSKKDIGIGDDIERLYRIVNITREISDPVSVSVENYIRLLEIMKKALTRLDPGAEFKEGYKAFANKLTTINNQNLTQTMLKNEEMLKQ